MGWKPFWQQKDANDNQETIADAMGTTEQTPADAAGTTANGNDKNVTELQEVVVTAPKPEQNNNEFVVSEEQLRDKGVDANGNFTVEPGMYDAVANANANDNANVNKKTPADAAGTTANGTTANGVDGNIDWDTTEEIGETGVKPLNIKPVTPAISGDPNETEEEKAARKQQRRLEYENEVRQQKLNDFATENPYVLEENIAGLYDKYKDKKPSEMLYNISRYREAKGLPPLTYEEKMMLLAGRDPNKSKKEVKAEKRRAKWADVLNELGNVLAHFYNYGRAKAGSPAAVINHTPSNNTERLRAADMAMRQRGYNDYVNAMANAEKRRQQREDYLYNLKMQREKAVEDAKLDTLLKKYRLDNDPETKLRYKILTNQYDISEIEKIMKQEKLEDDRAYRMGISPKAVQEKRYNDARIRKLESGTNRTNKGGNGNSNRGNNKYTYSYDIDGKTYDETDEYKAYTRAMAANHPKEPLKKKEKVTREDLIHAGVRFPGSGN